MGQVAYTFFFLFFSRPLLGPPVQVSCTFLQPSRSDSFSRCCVSALGKLSLRMMMTTTRTRTETIRVTKALDEQATNQSHLTQVHPTIYRIKLWTLSSSL